MFTCEYILNGECQLYSKRCAEECIMFNKCNVCKHKFKSMGCYPCNSCDALKGDGNGRNKQL